MEGAGKFQLDGHGHPLNGLLGANRIKNKLDAAVEQIPLLKVLFTPDHKTSSVNVATTGDPCVITNQAMYDLGRMYACLRYAEASLPSKEKIASELETLATKRDIEIIQDARQNIATWSEGFWTRLVKRQDLDGDFGQPLSGFQRDDPKADPTTKAGRARLLKNYLQSHLGQHSMLRRRTFKDADNKTKPKWASKLENRSLNIDTLDMSFTSLFEDLTGIMVTNADAMHPYKTLGFTVPSKANTFKVSPLIAGMCQRVADTIDEFFDKNLANCCPMYTTTALRCLGGESPPFVYELKEVMKYRILRQFSLMHYQDLAQKGKHVKTVNGREVTVLYQCEPHEGKLPLDADVRLCRIASTPYWLLSQYHKYPLLKRELHAPAGALEHIVRSKYRKIPISDAEMVSFCLRSPGTKAPKSATSFVGYIDDCSFGREPSVTTGPVRSRSEIPRKRIRTGSVSTATRASSATRSSDRLSGKAPPPPPPAKQQVTTESGSSAAAASAAIPLPMEIKAEQRKAVQSPSAEGVKRE